MSATQTERPTDEGIAGYRLQSAKRFIHAGIFNEVGGDCTLESCEAPGALDKTVAGFVHPAIDTKYGRRDK